MKNGKIKIAINGFGRIGREFFRQVSENPNCEIIAVNDLADKENLEYLLKYDSVHGFSNLSLSNIDFFQEKDPANLPWRDLGVDIVLESTGFFRELELASRHIEAGVKRVVISAPSSTAPTILMGINDSELADAQVSSNASCTTNAVASPLYVLVKEFGVRKAVLSTTHSYTSTQKLVDSPSQKDFRRGRAGAINIIPTSTGAAKVTTKVITELENKFDGLALRVPTASGSMADITAVLEKKSTKDEIMETLEQYAEDRFKGIFKVTKDYLVSSDIVGQRFAGIVDADASMLIDGDLLKLMIWYDNESGYVSSLVKHVLETAKYLD